MQILTPKILKNSRAFPLPKYTIFVRASQQVIDRGPVAGLAEGSWIRSKEYKKIDYARRIS